MKTAYALAATALSAVTGIWIVVAIPVIIAQCDAPGDERDQRGHAVAQLPDQSVTIAGAFSADGSCTVMADGTAIFTPGDSARTVYLRDRAENMAPPGYEVDEIWCAPGGASEPAAPSKPDDRAFFVNVYAPTQKLAPVRTYLVKRGMPFMDDTAGVDHRANISLFHPRYATRASDGAGVSYITGVSGRVTLTSVDSARVVGTFTARGVREWSMM